MRPLKYLSWEVGVGDVGDKRRIGHMIQYMRDERAIWGCGGSLSSARPWMAGAMLNTGAP